jgi:hypothetical protein
MAARARMRGESENWLESRRQGGKILRQNAKNKSYAGVDTEFSIKTLQMSVNGVY